jgi:hypothetical protein
VPLQSLAFETLAPRLRTTAASLLNLSRNIGGSVGISVVASSCWSTPSPITPSTCSIRRHVASWNPGARAVQGL